MFVDIPTGKSKGMPETTRARKLKPLSSSPPSSSSTSLDSPPLSPSKKAQTLMSRMSRRPLLKPLLFTLLLLSILYFLFPLSRSLSSPMPSTVNPPSNAPPPPKIYLYDLPHKFTHGVVESYALARSTPTVKYPGHQHSAEWFLFSDLANPNRPQNSPLALTSNPDDADLFFVPFFSSLSLVVNPIRPAAGDNGDQIVYSDEARQEELVEWLEKQEHWRRYKGRDHVFVCQDPNALYRVIGRIKNGVLLVSDFGRLRGDQASLVKDVILPYSHRINSYNGEVGVEKRGNLLFFMGNRYRKEGGKVRDTLFQILENQKDVVIKHGTQSRESRRMASQGMHSSKFCLHPAGDTPSACRLFDAIVSLCIPVIISDYIELPFEDAIDYGKIAIFVDTDNAVKPGYLISMLRDISTERILQYQQELKLVKRYFEYEDPNGTVNEIWRQVSSKLSLIKLMINRDKRLIDRGLDDPDCSCLCTKQNGTIAIR